MNYFLYHNVHRDPYILHLLNHLLYEYEIRVFLEERASFSPDGGLSVANSYAERELKKDIVKVNAYLTDLTRFPEYNEVYKEFFPSDPPARTTIGCQLYGIQVEINCVAVLPD